jgi:MarR family transcriptional regulator for hemolysin
MRVTDKLTGSIGLTGSRWLLLSAVVWRDEAPTITELSRRCLLSVQNVSRMVASMEAEGLIERVQHPGEGRAQRVVLTDRGIEVLEGTVELASRLREGFLAGLDDSDVQRLGAGMDRLLSNLRQMEQEFSS